jgi:aminoglycoside phosphotransferase family enzyme/predicted kinase
MDHRGTGRVPSLDDRAMAMNEAAQAEAIAFLCDPRTHGGAAVELRRTHASIIFLAGARALKLKRAVRYAFLDYSDTEKRRAACEAELALNRRTAPTLYRGVRAVTREGDGSLALDGIGTAVDWVVEMRRFPDEALFSAMLDRGKLGPDLLRALAEAIVAFHRAAEPTPELGGARGIEEVIAINETSLAATGLGGEALVAASRATLARHEALLERRRREGHVRQCHGDLHLGNIVLFEGKPTLFDGIEFSPSLASIDVLYDLAFLLMDLWHREARAGANLVFNRYLDLADEADGLPALPLFLSLRAAVRAHVAAAAGREEAGAYLVLAERLIAPPPPRLVAVAGLSGTGKSTVAAGLAPFLGAAPGARILRSDVLRKRMLGRAPEERLPTEAYDEETNRRVYAVLAAAAEAALAAGHSVALDAVAARAPARFAMEALAERAGVPFTGLWLEAPRDVLEGRIGARQRDASDAAVEVARAQAAYDTGPIAWTRVDAAPSPDAVLAAARRAAGV